jgi:hypothetical protein
MKEETGKKPADPHADGLYEAPKVIRVSLRPDEAVLGHCKVTGAMGPGNTGSCRGGGVPCTSMGS